MPFEYKRLKNKWYLILPAIFLSLVILIVSVIQASWAKLADDENYDRFRINPIEFEIEDDEGKKVEIVYNLPQISQVPGDFFYPLKRARDNLWLKLSKRNSQIEEGRMYLLLADKKIAELLILSQRVSDFDKMLACTQECVAYLEKAGKLSLEMDNVVEGRKIGEKVKMAKYFYSKVLESVGQVSGQESVYVDMIDRIMAIKERS